MTYSHNKRPNTPEWMTCENCTWSVYSNENDTWRGGYVCTRYPKVFIEKLSGVSKWQYPECGYACGEFRHKDLSWENPL